jgi:NADH-quinone oxidoreductase subunit M
MNFPILSLLGFLPILGAVLIFTLSGEEAGVARNARLIALYTSLLVLLLSLFLWSLFQPSEGGYQFVEEAPWLADLGASFKLGVDGISLFLILLTTLLTPISIVASRGIDTRVKEYMAAFLLLEGFTILMFEAADFLLFYLFFEAVLIPMYLLIGVWGGPRRVYAAVKFFLYTLAGSLLLLVALVWLWTNAGTTDIATLIRTPIPANVQDWIFVAFLAAFGVKAAVWPLHTWLPDAYGEAPLPATIMLAGVLSKMGVYGFLRFAVPMLPQATQAAEPLMFALGVIAVIYASLVALAQTDMKRMVAYSSVAHMGMIVIGIFTFTVQGVEGALVSMLSHGLVIAALFLCCGVILARGEALTLAKLGGLARRMPVFAVFLMLFVLASVGLPGTSGFVGEILVIVGALKVNFWVALLGGSGMILGAAYMLVLVRAVLFDRETRPELAHMTDVSWRDAAVLVPLAFLVLWLGIYPTSFTGAFDASVQNVLAQHTASLVSPLRDAMVSR